MTSIYDIYAIEECDGGICTTPANTMGMGNPMLPTAEEPGTEPIIPTAKTKTEKKQKRKVTKSVKEGVLADMENTLKNGDDTVQVVDFVNWYIDNQSKEYKRLAKDKIRDLYMTLMHFEDKNTVVIDLAKDDSSFGDILVIKDAIPGNVKTIKVYNCKYEFNIQSYIGDLSNVNIEVYRDNGKSFSNIVASFKSRAGDHIRFGKLICSDFELRCMAETLTIGNDSVILNLDTSASSNLTNIYGKLSNVDDATLNHKLVKTQLCQAGFLPWGCKLTVK